MTRRLALGALVLWMAAGSAFGQDPMAEIYQLWKAGKVVECRARCEALLKKRPRDSAPLHMLGRLCVQEGQMQQAIPHLLRCLELGPEAAWMTAWTHVALGQAYGGMGELEKARAHLEQAIALDATPNATSTARSLLSAHDFYLVDLDGRVWRRQDLVGRPALLKFGPSW